MAKRDYYGVLGVSRDASEQDIKKAYRRLAMKYHPDRNPDDDAAEASFKEASEAAEILLDAEKRSAYDQFGHAAVDGSAEQDRAQNRENAEEDEVRQRQLSLLRAHAVDAVQAHGRRAACLHPKAARLSKRGRRRGREQA